MFQILLEAYSLSKSEELQWARFVKDTLTNAGFPDVSTLPYTSYNLPAPLPPDQRVCWFCMGDSVNEIEDELHFLFNCRLYDQERLQLFAKCEQVNKSFWFFDKWNFISISQTDNKQLIYQYAK